MSQHGIVSTRRRTLYERSIHKHDGSGTGGHRRLLPAGRLGNDRTGGFTHIEVSRNNSDWVNAAATIRDLGLTVWACHGNLDFGSVSRNPSVRRQALQNEYVLLEQAACFAPCPYVIHYLNRFTDPEIRPIWHDSVAQLVNRTRQFALNIAVETAPYKPDQYARHPFSREIAEFVRSFASDDISICIDLNHSKLNEELPTVAHNCCGLISNIHVSDNLGIKEDHLPPGQGIINFDEAVSALRKAGYGGPINLEFRAIEPVTVKSLIRTEYSCPFVYPQIPPPPFR